MNENFDVKGPVRTLEQRRHCEPLAPSVDRLRDFESFDVEFSLEGQVQKLTTYTRMGVLDGFERFVYDRNGNQTQSLKFDHAGVQISQTDAVYDLEEGRVKWITRSVSGDLVNRGVDEYRDELLISAATFQSNGLLIVKKTFEYAQSKLSEVLSLSYGIDGHLAQQTISNYDSEGRLVETFGRKPNGEPLGDGRYEYEYDAEGRKSRVLTFNEWSHGDVPTHVSEFTYECDDHGNWVERRTRSRLRNDSHWQEAITSRKLAYYPLQ